MVELRRTRAFNALWAGESVNGLGSYVSMIALPLVAVSRLHASTFAVGSIEAVEWAPAVLIGLPVGAFIDRSSHRRRIMIAANLGQAAALGSVPLEATTGTLTIFSLLLAAVLAGLFGVFFQSAYTPYLRSIVDTEDLLAANAKLQTSHAAAQVSGPPLGGVLVQAVGATNAVLADALSFVVSMVCLLFVHPEEPEQTAASRPISAVAEGLRYLRKDSMLLSLAVTAAAANLLLTAIGAVEIVFLVRSVGLPAAWIGAVFASGGIGGLAGSLSATRIERRFGTTTIARLTLAFTSPFALLLPTAHRSPILALFVAGAFVVSFGLAIISVTFATLRQTLCPPHLLGRVGASSRMLTALTIPTGALIGGAMGQHLGTRTAIWVGSSAYAVMGLLVTASPIGGATHFAIGWSVADPADPTGCRQDRETPRRDRKARSAVR